MTTPLAAQGPVVDLEPEVLVDGQLVAGGWAGNAPLVVDGLRVTWGRDAVLEQPAPATGYLALFDPSRTWATREDRRGLSVQLRYRGTAPSGTALPSAVFFRGRIGSPLKVSLKTVTAPDGTKVEGALIQLPLQSVLADLANVIPRAAWPAETMLNRVIRIGNAARAVGVLTGGTNLRDYWGDRLVAPVAAADQVSLYEHLVAVYSSSGSDTLTYRPWVDDTIPVSDRVLEAHDSLATITWDASDPLRPRAGQGAYVKARGVDYPDPMEDSEGLWLDSAALEYDPADGITTPARITRVALTHPDGSAAYARRTVELRVLEEERAGGLAINELVAGTRTARVDSLVSENVYADIAAQDLTTMVRREGARWVLEPVRLVTRRAGGFPTVLAAQTLLAGYERNTPVYLQRSWLPRLDVRPVYGVVGGTIAYRRGGWEVDANLAGVATAVTQHAVTWEELDDGTPGYQLQVHDQPHTRGLHPSVTFEDLRFVGYGLNRSTFTPTAWDEFQ